MGHMKADMDALGFCDQAWLIWILYFRVFYQAAVKVVSMMEPPMKAQMAKIFQASRLLGWRLPSDTLI